MRRRGTAYVVLGCTAALLVGATAAIAADPVADRTTRCDEVLARTAERRGVTPDELDAALRARLLARLELAERDGRITPERAGALRIRVSEGELCALGRVFRVDAGVRGLLGAAARYLGLERAQLRAQLRGTSLAALAVKQGKSVDGLEAAMLAPAKAKLATAVARGRITRARAARVLLRLERRIDRLVQRVFPAS